MTHVGHATFLLQVGGLNLLTDPVWSRRASPFAWMGPTRLVAPGLAFDALPPLDGVLLSHDHYDHLDAPTVDRLLARFGANLPWLTPLGFRGWLEGRGASCVAQMDWWQGVRLTPPEGGAPVRVVCLPARHWCRRGLRPDPRLWGSWAVLPAGGPGLYFGGDSGYAPAFGRIGTALGPFRATLLPIGAYEPRWFMKEAHMNPEEAVRAYLDLGGRGAFVGMHWGVFRLTDEHPLEPPDRVRRSWAEAKLPARDLHLAAIGETVVA